MKSVHDCSCSEHRIFQNLLLKHGIRLLSWDKWQKCLPEEPNYLPCTQPFKTETWNNEITHQQLNSTAYNRCSQLTSVTQTRNLSSHIDMLAEHFITLWLWPFDLGSMHAKVVQQSIMGTKSPNELLTDSSSHFLLQCGYWTHTWTHSHSATDQQPTQWPPLAWVITMELSIIIKRSRRPVNRHVRNLDFRANVIHQLS